jgi:hypothetical protein
MTMEYKVSFIVADPTIHSESEVLSYIKTLEIYNWIEDLKIELKNSDE